jgi:hypothetical protein
VRPPMPGITTGKGGNGPTAAVWRWPFDTTPREAVRACGQLARPSDQCRFRFSCVRVSNAAGRRRTGYFGGAGRGRTFQGASTHRSSHQIDNRNWEEKSSCPSNAKLPIGVVPVRLLLHPCTGYARVVLSRAALFPRAAPMTIESSVPATGGAYSNHRPNGGGWYAVSLSSSSTKPFASHVGTCAVVTSRRSSGA